MNLNLRGTQTCRFSSTKPNISNPAKTKPDVVLIEHVSEYRPEIYLDVPDTFMRISITASLKAIEQYITQELKWEEGSFDVCLRLFSDGSSSVICDYPTDLDAITAGELLVKIGLLNHEQPLWTPKEAANESN